MVPEDTDDPGRARRPRSILPDPNPKSDASLEEDVEDNPDFASLLQNFEDDADLDDEVAGDLDPGIDLGESVEQGEDLEPAQLDLGELIEPPTVTGSLAGADELGPEGDAGGADAVEALPSAVDEDGEGVVGDDLAPLELGSLDAEAADDEEPPKISLDEIGVHLEEDPLGRAALPWLEVPIAPRPARSLVASFDGRIVTVGADVTVLDESGAEKILVRDAGGAVTSLLPDSDGAIFYTTDGGQLFRIGPRGRECITAWTDVFDLEGSAVALALGGMTPSSRPAMLLLAGDRRKDLLESTDHGSTFRKVDLGGMVVALSTGAPPVCLVKNERGVRVLRSEPTGGFSVTGNDFRGEGERQTLAASGDVVAALDPERGVQVSADGGRSFRLLPGFEGATAIAAGHVGGRPVVFAASFDAQAEATKIAYVDAATGDATIIAGVDSTDDEADEHARVASLAWNEHTETLWAAGPFGLRCFRRPTSA